MSMRTIPLTSSTLTCSAFFCASGNLVTWTTSPARQAYRHASPGWSIPVNNLAPANKVDTNSVSSSVSCDADVACFMSASVSGDDCSAEGMAWVSSSSGRWSWSWSAISGWAVWRALSTKPTYSSKTRLASVYSSRSDRIRMRKRRTDWDWNVSVVAHHKRSRTWLDMVGERG